MNDQSTATASKKNGAAVTPFDAIVELEELEQKRLEAELASMEAEIAKAEQGAKKRLAAAEESAKKNANQELQQFKETEPVTILKNAQKQAESTTKQLQAAYANNSATQTEAVISTYLQNV